MCSETQLGDTNYWVHGEAVQSLASIFHKTRHCPSQTRQTERRSRWTLWTWLSSARLRHQCRCRHHRLSTRHCSVSSDPITSERPWSDRSCLQLTGKSAGEVLVDNHYDRWILRKQNIKNKMISLLFRK